MSIPMKHLSAEDYCPVSPWDSPNPISYKNRAHCFLYFSISHFDPTIKYKNQKMPSTAGHFLDIYKLSTQFVIFQANSQLVSLCLIIHDRIALSSTFLH